MPTIVETINLHKHYVTGDEEVHALDGISMTVEQGEFVAVMGPSGSGKSTLLHLVAGLDLPTSGRVLVEGNDLSAMTDHQRTLFRRRRLGVIFQAYNLLPTLTARENVALPMMVDGVPASRVARKTDELIELVHLEHRASHRPQAMSGGEQQRVAIARALLNDPAVILADEPTGNLDSQQSMEIWELLARLSRELSKTVLMVTHEPSAAAHADRALVTRDGNVLGQIEIGGAGDALLVASRYQELAK